MLNLSNPAVCLDLLRKLHPVDVRSTHEMLTRMIGELLRTPPAANQYLEVLEAMRAMLAYCQRELARRYVLAPAVPGSEADRHLHEVAGLWRQMGQSYAHIASADRDSNGGMLADERALIAQRRLHYGGLVLFEHFRARRAVPSGVWRELHGVHAHARAHGIDGIRVADALNDIWRAQSSREAYIAILLADLANPFGRETAELEWVLRWVQRFAPYCGLDGERAAFKSGYYGIDPDSDEGLRPLGVIGDAPAALRFDGGMLATRMRALLTQFKRGVTPTALGLGEDCSIGTGSRLLLSLYRPWGRSTAGRRFIRRAGAGVMEITTDWLGIGFAVAGEVFQQPGSAVARSLQQDLSLLTFHAAAPAVSNGEHAQEQRLRVARDLGFDCERWQLRDQSVGGFRIHRQAGGASLAHRQLVGLRASNGQHCLLGDTRWLMMDEDGSIEAGIEILPGVPRVIAIRAGGAANGRLPYQQAFLLPGSTALQTAPSLVVPTRWFQAARIIEVRDGEHSRMVRLLRVLRHGANFDQCAFEDVALKPA